ncbi:Uncharacterised protein [Mycobacteroides abscessus subsp. abscessus]|nr:Uncharacterised protein [Mycobacteroides abscessus subsp. abscessus]
MPGTEVPVVTRASARAALAQREAGRNWGEGSSRLPAVSVGRDSHECGDIAAVA